MKLMKTKQILLSLTLACVSGVFAQEVDESLQVAREILDVRVLNGSSEPITSLDKQDFDLKINGRAISLQSLEWIDGHARQGQNARDSGFVKLNEEPDAIWETPTDGFNGGEAVPPGRLMVLFIQGELGNRRGQALLKVSRHLDTVFDALGPNDYMAVFSFHAHLRLHCDFTRDKDVLKEAVQLAVSRSSKTNFMAANAPSLTRHFDQRAGNEVAKPERALEMIAYAVHPFPGIKNVIYLGFGFGDYQRGIARMAREYDDAVLALNDARTTVFSVDITQSDYHSLARGMRRVADDTGGVYYSAYGFPENALHNIVKSMSGYYRLSFSLPDNLNAKPRYKLKLRPKGKLYVRYPYNGTRVFH